MAFIQKTHKKSMKHSIFSFFILLLTLYISIQSCQQNPENAVTELSDIDLRRGELLLCGGEEFGEISFFITCNNSSRKDFNTAVSLLHSFEYEEAEKMFVKVIDADPACSMAYWGVAMSIYHSLWFAPNQEELAKGLKLLEIANDLYKTEREGDYLDAIQAYFGDWENIDHKTRALAYEKKMEALHNKYPDDTEAAIFYALALRSTANPNDMNYTNQRKSGEILEAIFPEQPNHPGIAHYIIHNYDYPELAHLALTTARRYAEIAPASAHAQHMPSHIFTRLGLWDESISANINSAESAVCYTEALNREGHWDNEIHAIDYLVYAYLQKGDNAKALEQFDYVRTMNEVFPPSPVAAYPFAAIPARMALENKDWESAAGVELHESELDWTSFPWQKAMVHFCRSLGASHLGNIEDAEKEIEILNSLHEELSAKTDTYSADQVMVQIKASQAWLAYARGNHKEALSLMKESVALEDNTEKHPVTPGEIVPAKELLGDMFLSLERYQDALESYESNLQNHPNRFNSLYGAAAAARAIGEKDKTSSYFTQLTAMVSENSARPEFTEALEYLSI